MRKVFGFGLKFEQVQFILVVIKFTLSIRDIRFGIYPFHIQSDDYELKATFRLLYFMHQQ